MPVEFGENCWFFLKYTKKKNLNMQQVLLRKLQLALNSFSFVLK